MSEPTPEQVAEAQPEAAAAPAQSEISTEQAAATLEANRQTRIQQCSQEIEAALAKHNCEIDVAMLVRAGSVTPQVQVIAK